MKKTKSKNIDNGRGTWDINPVSRPHSKIGYDRNSMKHETEDVINDLGDDLKDEYDFLNGEVGKHSDKESLYTNRLNKLNELKLKNIDPYTNKNLNDILTPGYLSATFTVKSNTLTKDDEPLIIEDKTTAGRIISLRRQGKIIFLDIKDHSGKIQVFLSKNNIEDFSIFNDALDLGDIIKVTGDIKKTKSGEVTVFAKQVTILNKTLSPSVEKWHGIKDPDIKYRKRYLDLISNDQSIFNFKKRLDLIRILRQTLEQYGFLEVETPILQHIPGGASARPFVTHHNTYDIDLYLRVAPELNLKKLIVGGFTKVFEMNRCFRNEGVGNKHNPEFTSLELYSAYTDYIGLMTFNEEFLKRVLLRFGDIISYDDNEINISGEWDRVSFFDVLTKYVKPINNDLHLSKYSHTDLLETLKNNNIDNTSLNKQQSLDILFKELVQPHLINPTYVYDYPVEMSPLARRKSDNPDLIEKFQLYIGGIELVNGFSELNDPIDQYNRFKEQEEQRNNGDSEAQYMDNDYIHALEVGLPPTAGLGIGIDRLCMLLMNASNIKETIFFPLLR
jgi:lysyl-tRNA synthetase class 2